MLDTMRVQTGEWEWELFTFCHASTRLQNDSDFILNAMGILQEKWLSSTQTERE